MRSRRHVSSGRIVHHRSGESLPMERWPKADCLPEYWTVDRLRGLVKRLPTPFLFFDNRRENLEVRRRGGKEQPYGPLTACPRCGYDLDTPGKHT